MRQHPKTLEAQRGKIFEGMKIAPGGVELASVSQAFITEVSGVPDCDRKVKITPLTAGQGLQLKMSVRCSDRPVASSDVASVVKDRASRVPQGIQSLIGFWAGLCLGNLEAVLKRVFALR